MGIASERTHQPFIDFTLVQVAEGKAEWALAPPARRLHEEDAQKIALARPFDLPSLLRIGSSRPDHGGGSGSGALHTDNKE